MKLFRYHDVEYGMLATIHLYEYLVIRQTSCFWIIKFKEKEKKIGKNSIRKWAWPTVSLAYNSYKIRKLRQLELAKKTINKTKKILDYIGIDNNEIKHFNDLGNITFTVKMDINK